MLTRAAAVSFTVLMIAVLSTGCARNQGRGARFPDAARSSQDTRNALANAERITPLPRVAEEHPAPEPVTSLDRAETDVADKPDDPKRALALAFSYYKAKAYNDAARAFEKASRLLPDDPKPLLYLGYTQMAVGALDPALQTYERVIGLKGVSRDTISEAYLQTGNCRGALGETDKAIAAFTQSLGNNPKQGLASLALGGWAAKNKRYDQANDFLNDAARDLPDGRHRAQAYAALGKLAEAHKDAKTAATYYRKALAIDPENAWASEAAGRLKLGKPAA